MVSNQGILSNKWLLPLIAVSIAVMALAFWAMMGNKAQASHEPGHGSAKEGSRTSDLNVLGGGDVGGAAVGDWIHLSELDVAIHTSNKTLYTDVSLECGLSTKTKVKSKNGVADTSIASSSVEVKVLIDGVRAEPGVVNCCRRTQELTAEFQGLIDGCMTVDEFNNVIIDPDCVTPETLELILDTMNANSFNFIMPMQTGDHTVEVWTRISLSDEIADKTKATATIGKGSIVVEEVNEAKTKS